ncbi:hypothetical protein P879_07026 [Paragonimus westermani]|uniref:Outer dense fiber protein 2 n=1 Tax=Paragonimus westermani TaxID=34504 RepID=A0A8T0DFH9_9TREM|nr:hypothetical protein P879_07026 [Paragonimus westermani]
MTKGIVKLEGRHDTKSDRKSPIHLHISEDAPVHLHFEPEICKFGTITGHHKAESEEMHNAPKQKAAGISLQAPWVPPPAKTSTGRFSSVTKDNSCRRVRIMGKRCGGSTSSLHSDPEVLNEEKHRQLIDHNEAYVPHRDTTNGGMTIGDYRPELNGVTESVRLAGETTQLGNEADSFKQPPQDLEDGTLWTTSVLEEWLRDIDDSMTHVAKAVRNLEECLDEIVFEGRRLTSRDLNRLNQPRDDLVLHADVAVRAGRELCRWAASANRQQERYLARKLDQTQSKEHELASQVRQLNEKLQKTTFELEQKQRLLTEQQNEGLKFNTVNESLETMKGHLQRELRQRDSECNVAEANLEQMYQTKNALKRAARAQKKRADEAEQALAEALERLAAKEAMATHFQTRCEGNESRASTRDRTSSGERRENRSRSRTQYSMLSEKTPREEPRDVSPASSRRNIPSNRNELEEENSHLRTVAADYEQRLNAAEREMDELRASLNQCETMLHAYHRETDAQTEKLQTITEQLKETEEARKRSQAQLVVVEKRLLETEMQNHVRLDRLETAYLNRQKQRKHNVTDSENTEEMQTENRTQEQSLYKPTKKSMHGGYAITDSEDASIVADLRRQLADARSERAQTEHRAEMRMADLRAQLTQADATNRSLQAYLTFLKRSYASVFQPDLAPMFGTTERTVNVNLATGGYTSSHWPVKFPSHHVPEELDNSNLSALMPQALPTEKHRC